MTKKIFIAADHAGFNLKEYLVLKLSLKGYQVFNLGPKKYLKSDDYPDYAKSVCFETVRNKGSFGILICGSGMGMSIAANKIKGIRAALCFRPILAKKSREHNNANVLCLGAEYLTRKEAGMICSVFIESDFLKGRHQRRVDKIEKI